MQFTWVNWPAEACWHFLQIRWSLFLLMFFAFFFFLVFVFVFLLNFLSKKKSNDISSCLENLAVSAIACLKFIHLIVRSQHSDTCLSICITNFWPDEFSCSCFYSFYFSSKAASQHVVMHVQISFFSSKREKEFSEVLLIYYYSYEKIQMSYQLEFWLYCCMAIVFIWSFASRVPSYLLNGLEYWDTSQVITSSLNFRTIYFSHS